jgi:hypothetical protein
MDLKTFSKTKTPSFGNKIKIFDNKSINGSAALGLTFPRMD